MGGQAVYAIYVAEKGKVGGTAKQLDSQGEAEKDSDGNRDTGTES